MFAVTAVTVAPAEAPGAERPPFSTLSKAALSVGPKAVVGWGWASSRSSRAHAQDSSRDSPSPPNPDSSPSLAHLPPLDYPPTPQQPSPPPTPSSSPPRPPPSPSHTPLVTSNHLDQQDTSILVVELSRASREENSPSFLRTPPNAGKCISSLKQIIQKLHL
ncbi:hypothetical protein M422DRAFT_786378 [Sphaerobolus stellatus SS14]|uniref:Uncharacterized protein n=1 Tax=Sphaerobolus stellatus (strain SS14) TaxID=990650 RepID=A0A0C9UAY0_SPHS4|nr:hypothetical protein M422DRAFT_786378 [Sphaerobolus stellatus SS14]